jgi:hypothetical protein
MFNTLAPCYSVDCGPKVMKLFFPWFTNFHNKLESSSLASLSSLAYCLWERPGAYPKVERMKGTLIG